MVSLFSVDGKSTRDLIIQILAEEHPLTAKKLSHRIRSRGLSVTFQGVYKAITKLLEDGVLEKKGKEIELSKEWIRKTKTFMDKLLTSYHENRPESRSALMDKDIKVYYFKDLITLDKFWNDILRSWFKETHPRDGVLAQISGHAWYVLGQLEEETDIINDIRAQNLKFYTLSEGDTFLDRWAGSYYKDHGFHYATNKTKQGLNKRYVIVYGDNIMESIYPDDLALALDQLYEKIKEISDLKLSELIKILKKEHELKITMMKNVEMARLIKEDILRHFPGN